MKIEMGGKYVRRFDLDIQGNVKPDAKNVTILSVTLAGEASACYEYGGLLTMVRPNGMYYREVRHMYDLLHYPEPQKYNYDYPMVAITADTVITCKGKILLINRKFEPCRNQWSLIGGFVHAESESVIDGCVRETMEEVSIPLDKSKLEFIGFFDKPDRDPRGRVISFAYIIDFDERPEVIPRDDAKDYAWFDLGKLPELAFDHSEIINKSCFTVRYFRI